LQAHGLAQWRRDVEDVVNRLVARSSLRTSCSGRQRPSAGHLAGGLPGRRQRERVPRRFSPLGVNA
jgi:hypothetical protein